MRSATMAPLARPVLLLLALSLLLPSCTLGGPEIALVALVLLLLFGGSKLPQLMRGMGSGVHEFRKGLKEGEGDDGKQKKEGSGEDEDRSGS